MKRLTKNGTIKAHPATKKDTLFLENVLSK